MTAADTGDRALDRWLRVLASRHPTDIDLDLSRCGAVWRRLGAPRPARRIITVAGTNGKGSTVAWISAVLGLLGERWAAYTSPHLLRFNERLRIDGQDVESEALVAAFERVEAARSETSLTYFEFTTLACFLIMAESSLDTAVLEVGLGGRLDTVNLVGADIAVITPIGLDHQAFLGEDRLSIGREKAGILRPRIPCIAAERHPPVSVLERAEALDCRLLLPHRDYGLEGEGHPGRLTFRLGEERVDFEAPVLAGPHQRDNLACGLAAVLTRHPPDARVRAALDHGLASASLPGRLQAVGHPPGWLVDVGHNPMAAAVIAEALAARDQRCLCVLGMLADKDAESVARLLAPQVDAFLCAGLEDGWRAQPGHVLSRRVRAAVGDDKPVLAFPTVGGAMVEARRRSDGAHPVLVFGSFHTAAQALRWLHERGLDRPAPFAAERGSAETG